MAVVSYVADCAHGAVTLAACCCLLTQWRWRKCMRMYYVIRIYINKYSLSFLRAIGSITLDYTHALPSFLTLRACFFHFILPIATSLRFDAIQNLISNLFPDCVAVSNDLLCGCCVDVDWIYWCRSADTMTTLMMMMERQNIRKEFNLFNLLRNIVVCKSAQAVSGALVRREFTRCTVVRICG